MNAVFAFNLFEILLFEGRSVMEPAQVQGAKGLKKLTK